MFLMPPMYFILAGDIGLWPSAWYGRREKFLGEEDHKAL